MKPVVAAQVQARTKSIYPDVFAARVAGREKRALGDAFGLSNFAVNLTTLPPGVTSALRHYHAKQDEFVYVLQGEVTLINNDGETVIRAGMCAGFKAGTQNAHQLINRSDQIAVYLEVGDRSPDDTVVYPDDDIAATLVDGSWQFTHKNGEPY